MNSLNYYNTHAEELAAQYQSLAAENVHKDWLGILQQPEFEGPLRVLDIGAGSGRDAAFFATERQGNQVIAVEPADELVRLGKIHTQGLAVTWCQDSMPDLAGPEFAAVEHSETGLDSRFNVILLSAVWMHLPAEQRPKALIRLAELLADNGLLVISLRLTISEDDIHTRKMFPVSASELESLVLSVGLKRYLVSHEEADQLGRSLSWQTIVLSKGHRSLCAGVSQ
ncbi:class I SAM-dependent methyltransferase [Shewanella submarina]|uniref:Class I SAM-dependent methyltransferase n=1 Tax=Shewanella submarina TaxID=2016376 RepID=A0ABV7GHL5_9GAMM|nr:class I SAM-dependent methyltransferase [Shewanella submarina]MCL1039633.1 class I SAM-dependent methyltransferase [Shewanella submarina]